MSQLLVENRNGLVVDVATMEANSKTERQAALKLLAKHAKRGAAVGADKGYDTADFVAGCRKVGVTPHVARKKTVSVIDGRTLRHAGYQTSRKVRKRIDEGPSVG
jgi:IS5 family transposase